MITKAIIESIESDGFHFKVRIPVLNKIEGVVGATPFNELPIALANCPPGINPNYSVGDVVFVGFEDNQYSQPVILGNLYNESYANRSSSVQSDSLNVSLDASLPEANKIQIGDRTLEDILIYYSEL